MILSSEQTMVRDAMRTFAQERLAPFSAQWDRDKTFPAEALKELGTLGDFSVERIYRDVRVCQICEGASDIQRLVIGRALAEGNHTP